MNSPERTDNTGLIPGVALLFGGTIALVTGHATLRGHEIEGPLTTAAGITFLILGVVFLALLFGTA